MSSPSHNTVEKAVLNKGVDEFLNSLSFQIPIASPAYTIDATTYHHTNMSSNPSGLRFSPFSQKAQQQTKSGTSMASGSSTDGTPSMLVPSSGRSMSEARNPLFGVAGSQKINNNNSNRNSLKESTSNRSSMDVSTCSYNTLIIHNDDNMYSSGGGGGADYGGASGGGGKKERPRSFGTDQVIKEILETPDYNQNSVLKQLVKVSGRKSRDGHFINNFNIPGDEVAPHECQ